MRANRAAGLRKSGAPFFSRTYNDANLRRGLSRVDAKIGCSHTDSCSEKLVFLATPASSSQVPSSIAESKSPDLNLILQRLQCSLARPAPKKPLGP